MKCWNHPDEDASYTCAKCGNSICEKCSIRYQNTIFCTECVNKSRQISSNKEGISKAKQNPQSYTPPAKPKKKTSPLLMGCLIVIGITFLYVILQNIISFSTKSIQSPKLSAPNIPSINTPVVTPADNTQPVITEISATTTPNGTSAIITWKTNKTCSSQIEYGKNTQYGNLTPLVTASSLTITNLEVGNFYHYRVRSKDTAGNETISGDNAFATSIDYNAIAPAQAPSNYTPSTTATSPELTIDAVSLYNVYHNNEIAGDAKYKGKNILVTGGIGAIGKDLFGSPYIVLLASPISSIGVQCDFPSSYASQLINLSIGQRVRVQGTCSGYIISVLLDNCSLR